jgi:NAD(P)-dependent dehydrogenase (short-subunit alcohol dehydrogenase family)
VSVVVTGSECGVFGQAGHVEYASGKAGLQYGLVKTVKNEIVRLNGKGRINAVAPGWVDTKLIEGRLDDPREMWREAEATYVFDYGMLWMSADEEKSAVEEDCTAE